MSTMTVVRMEMILTNGRKSKAFGHECRCARIGNSHQQNCKDYHLHFYLWYTKWWMHQSSTSTNLWCNDYVFDMIVLVMHSKLEDLLNDSMVVCNLGMCRLHQCCVDRFFHSFSGGQWFSAAFSPHLGLRALFFGIVHISPSLSDIFSKTTFTVSHHNKQTHAFAFSSLFVYILQKRFFKSWDGYDWLIHIGSDGWKYTVHGTVWCVRVGTIVIWKWGNILPLNRQYSTTKSHSDR